MNDVLKRVRLSIPKKANVLKKFVGNGKDGAKSLKSVYIDFSNNNIVGCDKNKLMIFKADIEHLYKTDFKGYLQEPDGVLLPIDIFLSLCGKTVTLDFIDWTEEEKTTNFGKWEKFLIRISLGDKVLWTTHNEAKQNAGYVSYKLVIPTHSFPVTFNKQQVEEMFDFIKEIKEIFTADKKEYSKKDTGNYMGYSGDTLHIISNRGGEVTLSFNYIDSMGETYFLDKTLSGTCEADILFDVPFNYKQLETFKGEFSGKFYLKFMSFTYFYSMMSIIPNNGVYSLLCGANMEYEGGNAYLKSDKDANLCVPNKNLKSLSDEDLQEEINF